MLPREALELLFSNSETCLSEFQLFEVIERKLLQYTSESVPQVINDENRGPDSARSHEEIKGQPLVNR